MKLLIGGLVMILWHGCAPLTSPLDQPGTDAQGAQEATPEKPSALAQYLKDKRHVEDSTAVAPQYIAVMPFVNTSGFREGVWEIEQAMAYMLSVKLAAYPLPNWRVVPYEAMAETVENPKKLKPEQVLEAGRILEADMLVQGTLKDYDMKRISVGDPLLGGYKSYTGIADVELKALWVRDQREAGTVRASREIIDRDLGLDLLGKPRAQDVQFLGLKDMTFGSEEFLGTAIGQATVEAMDEVIHKLEELIRPSGLKLGNQPAEILSVYEDEIYINIGSENRLHAGLRFEVYPGPKRAIEENLDTLQSIGVLEVQEIVGARLSKVRLLQGQEHIKAGDRLKLLESED